MIDRPVGGLKDNHCQWMLKVLYSTNEIIGVVRVLCKVLHSTKKISWVLQSLTETQLSTSKILWVPLSITESTTEYYIYNFSIAKYYKKYYGVWPYVWNDLVLNEALQSIELGFSLWICDDAVQRRSGVQPDGTHLSHLIGWKQNQWVSRDTNQYERGDDSQWLT